MIREGFTFDDLLLVPRASRVLPVQARLKTRLARKINLNIPLVSAAMDTVTDAKLAIALAQHGGIGIIHKNFSVEEQVREVEIVKRAANGIVHNPIALSPEARINEAMEYMQGHSVSSFVIVKNKKVVGILTNRDLRFQDNLQRPVSDIMTREVITAPASISLPKAKRILMQNKIEKLVLVNKKKELKGLVCIKDILNDINFPNATKDKDGRLRVGAACGAGSNEIERALALVKAGTDVLVVDTAHGHHSNVISAVKQLKKKVGDRVQLIAGNIATGEGCKALIEAGADGVKAGVGPGSICTTMIVAGVGVPQATAIMDVYKTAKQYNIPVIADGGIKYSGDVAKALALGASAVMIGSLFAGADEAPGETIYISGRAYKTYRGMGSIGAMKQGSKDRYFQSEREKHKLVPEGIEGGVPLKGNIKNIIMQLVGGITAAMGYCGAADLKTLVKKAKFVKMTSAGFRESHAHDVAITKEAPNYQIKND